MIKFTNNASSLIASGISNVDGQVTVGAGEASLFPSPTGGDYAVCTLEDISGNLEIVHMTARAGTLCTITRAREGTTAIAFSAGSRFELRVTAGVLDSFLQKAGDTITGPIVMTGAGRISGGGYDGGETVGTRIRGDSGVSSNEFYVPPGGGPPTISAQTVYHAGNLTRAVVAAILFPTGAIINWFGTIPSIPAGWILCDGTGGTPDLRDKFVVGAGSTYALSATGGAVSAVSDGGNLALTIASVALSVAQLPSHTHFVASTSAPVGGDVPPTNTAAVAATSDVGGDTEYHMHPTGAADANVGLSSAAGSGDTHTHAPGAQSHTHSVATLPPYFGLYYIMKT